MRRLASRAAAALLVLGWIAAPALAQGCALCRRNLEQNGGEGLIRGIYWTILLLTGLPFLMAGAFLLLLRRARRRADAAAAAGGGVVPAAGLEPATRGL